MLNTACHKTLRIAGTVKDSIVDGPGIRYVIFTQGCPHHCPGCHNPQTHDFLGGQDADLEIILREILENPILSGITFSGGDPLHPANRQEIGLLMQEIRQRFPQKTIWLYTGDNFEDFCAEAFTAYIDVCVDGVFLLEQKDTKLRWKGSKNQRVIDVKKSLALGKVILYVED